jgi:hypothetical protein
MPEKQLLDVDIDLERRILDVNTVAIFFVEDRFGQSYVSPALQTTEVRIQNRVPDNVLKQFKAWTQKF